MATKKTRLQRKPMGGKKESRLDISKQFSNLSNAQVEAYASAKSRDPVTMQLKQYAVAEVTRRNKVLKVWKSGTKPAGSGVKGIAKTVIGDVRKGVGLVGKAISGELQKELEEGIATVGMKPEEKKRVLAERKASEIKRAADEKKEFDEMRKLGYGG